MLYPLSYERWRVSVYGNPRPACASIATTLDLYGHNALDARIAHAYQEFVATGKYVVTLADDVTRHHDIVTFTIQLTTLPARSTGPPASSCSSAPTASSSRTTS
jgi:hypothetical protein